MNILVTYSSRRTFDSKKSQKYMCTILFCYAILYYPNVTTGQIESPAVQRTLKTVLFDIHLIDSKKRLYNRTVIKT